MQVKDLIAALKKFPPTAQIVLSSDSEGNSYSPGCDLGQGVYEDGQFYSLDYSAEDNGLEDDEWEKLKADKSVRCVCIWP